jgi:DNA-binding XRE family transcriptional regulator
MWLETNKAALKAFRVKAGFSQREMAKKLGVAHTTIMRIENGDRNASPKLGKKIAKFLQVPMEAIFFIQYDAEWQKHDAEGEHIDENAPIHT